MRRLTYLLCLPILASLALAADPSTDPKVVEARAAYETARLKLETARRKLSTAERALDNARDYRARSQRELSTAETRQTELRSASDSAESDARRLKTERDGHAKQIVDLDAQLADTKKALVENQSDIDSLTKESEQRFMKSPETQQRLVAIEAARVAVEAEAKRVIDALLANDSYYGKLHQDAVSAEKVLKEMRDDSRIDAKTLADFSQKWIDAKSRRETAERAACEADPAYTAAAEAYSLAQKAQSDALAEFKKSLTEDPAMRALVKKSADYKKSQSEITQRRTLASADLKKSESSMKTALSRYQSASTRLEQSKVDYDRVRASVASAEAGIDSATTAMTRAQSQVLAAQRDLEIAKRRLQEAEAAAKS